jgi:hypothetical protein
MPVDASIYGKKQRGSSLADLGSAYNMVQGVREDIQKRKLQTREEQDREDVKFMSGVFGKAFQGYTGEDEGEANRRAAQAVNDILSSRPDLGSKVYPVIQELEKSQVDIKKDRTLQEGYSLDNKKKEFEFKKEQSKLKSEVLGGATANDYLSRLSYLQQQGIDTRQFPQDFTQFESNRDMFLNGMQTEERIWDAAIKAEEGKQAGISTKQAEANLNKTYAETDRIRKGQGGESGLSYADNLAAWDFAMQLGKGSKGAKLVYPMVIKGVQEGKTVDQIADDVRMSRQSEAFTGPARMAMQQIFAGKSGKAVDDTFDYFDDLLEKGDTKAIAGYLKNVARKQAPTDTRRQIEGQERTIQLLDEIQTDLDKYEQAGGDTNIFTGTAEKVAGKIGMVNDPELRSIAQRVQGAIQKYRKDMSGVAFSVPEGKEYRTMFPNIDKTATFNRVAIDALKRTFSGNVQYFYENAMGEDAYNALVTGGGNKPSAAGTSASKYLDEIRARRAARGQK